MFLKRLGISLFALTLGLFSQLLWATQSPTVHVQDTVDSILTTISNSELSDAQQRTKVFNLIAARFDFQAMAQRALSTNWQHTSEAQRQQFTELFRQILSHTYWQRVRGHGNHRVSYVKERIRNESFASVSTIIKTETGEIPVDYRLRLNNKNWLAFDVVIEGVSLVRNYRAEYRQIVKRDGIDSLLTEMRAKVESLAAY